jgi:hypothetical protein
MKFRNYCLVVFGNTVGIFKEVVTISEIEPNVLDAKGVSILTFTSNIEPRELNDYFRTNKRNFLLFDLNPDSSGFNFEKLDINNGLFGYLKYMDEQSLQDKTDRLINELEAPVVLTKTDDLITVDDIDGMNPVQKNELLNILIDRGISKSLSANDQKLLKKLSS